MIEDIITLLRAKTEYKYYFNATPKIENCVVYSYTDTSNDKVKKTAQLQLTIIVKGISEKSILTAEKMKSDINDCIITRADNSLTGGILKVSQNGGGQLVDHSTQTLHCILYYDIIERQ